MLLKVQSKKFNGMKTVSVGWGTKDDPQCEVGWGCSMSGFIMYGICRFYTGVRCIINIPDVLSYGKPRRKVFHKHLDAQGAAAHGSVVQRGAVAAAVADPWVRTLRASNQLGTWGAT